MIQPPGVVYVDIDDTLVRSFGSKRVPMTSMIELVRSLKGSGAELYCWSSGGAAYARSTAQELGLEACFEAFLPKPHLMLDDAQLADWRVVQLHPTECFSLSAAEVLARIPR